jgi:hypothetical protein
MQGKPDLTTAATRTRIMCILEQFEGPSFCRVRSVVLGSIDFCANLTSLILDLLVPLRLLKFSLASRLMQRDGALK